MKTTLVRYKLKAGRAEENEKLIRNVFEQLGRERPAGLRYASFKLEDGLSFVHIASLEAPGAGNPLTELSAFKAFTAEIRERCAEPPVAASLTEIGAYRFFGS